MKQFFLYLLFFALIGLHCCKSGYKNENSASAKDSSSALTSLSSDTSIVNNKEVNNPTAEGFLYQKTKLHAFSNPGQLDTFTIEVKGKDYLSAQVHISIHNAKGK